MFRGSGTRMAELAGADDNSIRRLGGWNRQVLDNVYLSSMPRPAMRGLAGFSTTTPSFFLRRGTLEPSDALKRRI